LQAFLGRAGGSPEYLENVSSRQRRHTLPPRTLNNTVKYCPARARGMDVAVASDIAGQKTLRALGAIFAGSVVAGSIENGMPSMAISSPLDKSLGAQRAAIFSASDPFARPLR